MITSFFKPKNAKDEPPKRQRPENSEEMGGATKKRNKSDAVEELISSIPDTPSATSWTTELEKHFVSASFQRLAAFVQLERSKYTVFPPADLTFSALQCCPLDAVRVVIVGQDPYHGPGQAHGLCFSVLPTQPTPPSLRNIYAELRDDPDVDFPQNGQSLPKHGYLMNWAKQGVLMLNTVLTVRKGEANSHQKKGWEVVTDEIIRAVDRVHRHKGVVFLLWGKPATSKTQTLVHSSSSKHTFICTSHPSPLGASKTNSPFLGSKCFSRCNQALKEKGFDPIDWNVQY